MPQAIPAIADKVGMLAFQAASQAGVNIYVSATLAKGAALATSVLIYAGLTAALTPRIPDPESAAQTKKQTRPARVRGGGIARVGTYLVLPPTHAVASPPNGQA